MSDLIDRSALPTMRIEIPASCCDVRIASVVEIVAKGFQAMIDSAPTVDAVPRDEYDALLKRFRHLLESDFIRSFDQYDPRTQTYKRDIAEADNVDQVVRCKHCRAWGESAVEGFKDAGFCIVMMRHSRPDFYCAYGRRRDGDSE